MGQDALEKLLGRLLTDDEFRKKSIVSLAAACDEAGFRLTVGELKLITREHIRRLENVSHHLDTGIKRFGGICPSGNKS